MARLAAARTLEPFGPQSSCPVFSPCSDSLPLFDSREKHPASPTKSFERAKGARKTGYLSALWGIWSGRLLHLRTRTYFLSPSSWTGGREGGLLDLKSGRSMLEAKLISLGHFSFCGTIWMHIHVKAIFESNQDTLIGMASMLLTGQVYGTSTDRQHPTALAPLLLRPAKRSS